MRDRIVARLSELQPTLVERRRDFHRHPELALHEHRTSEIVADWLTRLGLEVQTKVFGTGVVGRIRGKSKGKHRTIALRADMDALPIQDAKVGHRDYASTVPGVMHACGHDAHVTMLLGAATVLTELRDDLAGDVVLLFQPAEEGVGGAEPMIKAGVLEGVDFILGQHMTPLQPAGEVGVSHGPAMAAADKFLLKIRGKGGHGAYPHLTVDAVQISAQVITALQAIVARTVDPLQSAVVSVGTIHGGYNFNVIADVVEMKGTVRSFDATLRRELHARLEKIVRGVTEAYGASYELDYEYHYPPTINHASGVAHVLAVADQALGQGKAQIVAPSMGAEDFSYFLEKIPGCFYWIGGRAKDPIDPGYGLHHPAFDIDETALSVGAQMFVEGSMSYLAG